MNGIPLGVVECKNPKIEDPLEEGLDQIARYQNNRGHEQDEGAEELFRFNQFSVVTSKTRQNGYIQYSSGRFKPWKDAYPTSDLE
ncbi:HsdR family type I site-specific deoxyribonuclease [Candidatus Haloredivivus sp. G17]|nr:HsdR family type I site-specific deoxyribonuclease [Candidatus Haloredivivus sp. G17]